LVGPRIHSGTTTWQDHKRNWEETLNPPSQADIRLFPIKHQKREWDNIIDVVAGDGGYDHGSYNKKFRAELEKMKGDLTKQGKFPYIFQTRNILSNQTI
jgi:hypothetical protein